MKGKIAAYIPIGARRGMLTLDLDGDFRDQFDKLKDSDIEVSFEKYREKRSLSANSLLWEMCSKIAKKMGSTKEEVYREHIREVGEYTPLPIKSEAVDHFSQIWSEHGLGWFVDVVDDSKLPGYKLVFAYQGSSTYNTEQMSRLIDSVMSDAKEIGIETISDRERSLLFA